MRRRDFLVSSLGVGLAGLPVSTARAAVSAADRKFIFLFCGGGWDPAMVFAPDLGDGDSVDRESDSVTATAGNITYVSNPARPGVDDFFSNHAENTLLFNALEVRNVDHTICTHLAKTGGTGGDSPDWATIIAQARSDDFIIPHLALSGPAFTGPYATSVVRVSSGDALYNMLSGSLLAYSAVTVPSFASRGILDDYAVARQQAVLAKGATGRRLELLEDLGRSLDVMEQAEPYREILRASASLSQQVSNAVDVLSSGLSRCVSLSQTYNGYDSHSSNFYYQDLYINDLFEVLSELMALLAATPGTTASSLLEETTVVVHSEMGKTPQLNSGSGKDHWPFTTAMLLGTGFSGNRVVGAYDTTFMGQAVDFASGDLYEKGTLMTATSIGATVLAMADVDPGEWSLDSSPVQGVLA